MTEGLRILLIIFSILFLLIIIRKIRSSSVRIIDMFYWIVMSALFVFMAVCPDVVMRLSHVLGFESPVNFVLVVVIFLLMWKIFLMAIQISSQNEQFKDAVEELTIRLQREENVKRKDTIS